MFSPESIAQAFVNARRTAQALPDYPGAIPARLADSYAIQDRAIALWNQPIAGWKIGRLAPDRQAEHGTERLTGPIFAISVRPYVGQTLDQGVFEGGFAAVEAEFVFRLGRDAEPGQIDYTPEQAMDLIDAMFAGIEMAGSPLATINALGPTVIASDFGNNFGLILGPQLASFGPGDDPAILGPEWTSLYRAETSVDGVRIGQGGLFSIPGGPLAAIAWLAGHLAERGRPLRKGQLISSGATTGIHDVGPGQAAEVVFFVPAGQSCHITLNTSACRC